MAGVGAVVAYLMHILRIDDYFIRYFVPFNWCASFHFTARCVPRCLLDDGSLFGLPMSVAYSRL